MKLDWEDICERFGPIIWSVAIRILKRHNDAVDCYQEVLLEAFQDPKQSDIDNWGAYLRWLTTRRAIDMLRKRSVRESRNEHGQQNDPANVADTMKVDTNVEFDEFVSQVRDELATLPAPQSQAFWLVSVEQCSYEEVAKQMGVDRNHLGVLIHRARKHLQKQLNSLAPNQNSKQS